MAARRGHLPTPTALWCWGGPTIKTTRNFLPGSTPGSTKWPSTQSELAAVCSQRATSQNVSTPLDVNGCGTKEVLSNELRLGELEDEAVTGAAALSGCQRRRVPI